MCSTCKRVRSAKRFFFTNNPGPVEGLIHKKNDSPLDGVDSHAASLFYACAVVQDLEATRALYFFLEMLCLLKCSDAFVTTNCSNVFT
jgi:hypothetical protein